MSSVSNERQENGDVLPLGRGTLNRLAVFLKKFLHLDKGRLGLTVFSSAPEVVSAERLRMVTVAGDVLSSFGAPASVRFFAGPSAAAWRCDLLAFLHYVS